MAGEQIEIPSFEFGAFYYPDILESLVIYKRQNVPELTDESEFEPFIQLLRAFALVGHLNNVLLDQAANESTLPTARLPETVRNMLRLIDVELRPATPAQTDMVYLLSRVFTVATEAAPAAAQFATKRAVGDEPVVFFEDLEGTTVDRGDQLGACFEETTGGLFVDHTAAANSGAGFTPGLDVGAKLYFGHANIMWGELAVDVQSASQNLIGVWEFYDGDQRDVAPTTITNIGGGSLQIGVNSLLGASNRAGAEITVLLNSTTAIETAISTWDGSKNIVTVGLLGQSAPSEEPTDYTIGSDWHELDTVSDATVNLTNVSTELVEYDLPQDEQRDWNTTTINGFEGFFLRYRVVEVTLATTPTLGRIRIDTGNQYAKAFVTQGRSMFNETLGSSNGNADQRFTTQRDYFILNSQEVRVDSEVWTEVPNFLNSLSQDKHYKLVLGDNDRATVVFGDGNQGRIPPIGQGNIVIDYRFGANNKGNVGARTIVVDKTGLTFVNSIYNPRQATGWAKAQAADREALEQAKEAGPASLRVREVAISPEDVEELAIGYVDDLGTSPFARAKAIEEGFGPKTVELVLVARGGGQATTQQLDAIKMYVNGDKFAVPAKPKRIVANQQAVAVNFQPRPISVTAVVEAPSGVTTQQITNQLAAILQPEALKADGVTFIWEFGAEIPRSRIIHEIFKVDSRITEVDLQEPAANVPLQRRELPTNGSFSITVVSTL
jgi:hypothetical protein